jgi:hypothetical protein
MSSAIMRSWLLAFVCVALVGAGRPPKTLVVAGTLEAAVGQPLVHVQVKDGQRVLTARPTELERLLGDAGGAAWSFTAHLDTGSSSYVISKDTAARFGLEAVEDAAYHEVGLHGAVRMGVSRPYSLSLGDFGGAQTEEPVEFLNVARNAAFQLNLAEAPPQLALVGGGVDVVGMPAIKRLVIEIDPTAMSDRLVNGARSPALVSTAAEVHRHRDSARVCGLQPSPPPRQPGAAAGTWPQPDDHRRGDGARPQDLHRRLVPGHRRRHEHHLDRPRPGPGSV